MSGIKVVFGGAGINKDRALGNVATLKSAFDLLEQNGVTTIDTANLYGDSETILGDAGAPGRFTIDTKTRGGFKEGGGARDAIIEEATNSRSKLGTVDIFYIHAPDGNTPLKDTLAAINEVHKTGFFKRFGLSNYKAGDVQKVYDHCKEQGYVLPTVYQGNFSAVARKQESLLFPTLRKLDISFYAYSPLAGGFLSKSKAQIEEGSGRFNSGSMYNKLYAKEAYLNALDQWASIAKDEGITRADLAYRWVRYNSPLKPEHGDALIVGASSIDQLKETLTSIGSGPLSDKAVKRIDELWEVIAHEAPLDNFHY
ncbi:Putative NADP-dependent oxidoreductase domain-containing protein [Septoria linicola]|uniref:NADP-dependent oxidoreductase domain-containing protein n=1 Tax=Septoria linicola TaxID=215465 RepID=A0A9Q9AJF3_9PEZI|nr:Putative NADP-dependent oxidoreductase domain-containing protein [Septoria linicola]